MSSVPSSSWWEYLHFAAGEAYGYSVTRQHDDPRGPPGTITTSFGLYGVNPPVYVPPPPP